MSYRRGSVFVHSANLKFEEPLFPYDSTPHPNFIFNRGICILCDSNTIAGERAIREVDLKVTYDGEEDGFDPNRYTLQLAVVPDGTQFEFVSTGEDYNCTYPMAQDTLYVTSLYDAHENGIKLTGLNKGLPKGYYLVCYIWQNYDSVERVFTSEFFPESVYINGRLNITF